MGNLQISYIEINKWLYVLLGLQNYHNENMFFFKFIWFAQKTCENLHAHWNNKMCDTHVYSMYKNYVNFPSEKW